MTHYSDDDTMHRQRGRLIVEPKMYHRHEFQPSRPLTIIQIGFLAASVASSGVDRLVLAVVSQYVFLSRLSDQV